VRIIDQISTRDMQIAAPQRNHAGSMARKKQNRGQGAVEMTTAIV